MIPLVALGIGEKATVLRICGDDAEISRLRSLGIDINTEVTVVTSQAAGHGPVLLMVNGGKYAIDFDLASTIMVMP